MMLKNSITLISVLGGFYIFFGWIGIAPLPAKCTPDSVLMGTDVGREVKGMCIHITDPLFWSPETNRENFGPYEIKWVRRLAS